MDEKKILKLIAKGTKEASKVHYNDLKKKLNKMTKKTTKKKRKK